jgi:putative SOS response-associated peptidase YedK
LRTKGAAASLALIARAPWAKDDKLQYSTFNARAEDFTTKPSFRDAWKWGQRCLVVTDGFYEWKKLDPKGQGGAALRRRHGRRGTNGDGRALGQNGNRQTGKS